MLKFKLNSFWITRWVIGQPDEFFDRYYNVRWSIKPRHFTLSPSIKSIIKKLNLSLNKKREVLEFKQLTKSTTFKFNGSIERSLTKVKFAELEAFTAA